jgi:hypothetical protein
MPETEWKHVTAAEVVTMLVNEFRNALTNTFDDQGVEANPQSAEWITVMTESKRKGLQRSPDLLPVLATQIHGILETSNHRGSAPLDTEYEGPGLMWIVEDPPEVSKAILDVLLTDRQKSVLPIIIQELRGTVQ